ncbi:MAG: hypothetical protein F4066_11535 [Chloroflexi bacterium]|nr:hypothetical protein [Chloroflexota bacterium]MYF82437.1 hypothetical protein [Chloroflexota bacterium]MYI05472.1 hypothetical protein [Chloroflexota bacterium]
MSRRDGESLQWHDGRRMVTVWVGRGQHWAGSARDQARRANRRTRNPLERFLLWLIGIPLGLAAAALGLAVTIVVGAALLLLFILTLWAGMGFAGAAMASHKGRPPQLGWLLGLTLGPIGLLLIRRLL